MSIQKTVIRKLTISDEDVRTALWHYLKNTLDQPMPTEADQLTVTRGDFGVDLSWTETTEVEMS